MPPENAKRVFQGEIFDVWQWEQKLFDGSTATFECIKRPDVVSVIAAVGEKIIVQEQEQPDRSAFFSVPGGRADHHGDTPKKAAIRELREETGYRPRRMVRWFTIPPRFRVMSSAHVYIAQDCTRIGRPRLDGGERIIVRPVSFSEFLRIAARPGFRHEAITIEVLRAQLNARALNELRRKLFGRSG